MKSLIFSVLLILPQALLASQVRVYECTASLPAGTATVTIDFENRNLAVDYYNSGLDQVFEGDFALNSGFSEEGGRVTAYGGFTAGEEFLEGSVLGGYTSEDQSELFLSLHSNTWDPRIEHGYGNHLACDLVQN